MYLGILYSLHQNLRKQLYFKINDLFNQRNRNGNLIICWKDRQITLSDIPDSYHVCVFLLYLDF